MTNRNKKRKMKKNIKIIAFILIVVIVLVGGILIYKSDTKKPSLPSIIPATKTTENKEAKFTFETTIDKLETYYLALGGKKTLEINYNTDEFNDYVVTWDIEDSSIISIDENNTILGLKNGTTTLKGTMKNGFSRTYNIMVTDLIVPPKVNHSKKALPCNRYSKEEADLLDKILASRVEEAGVGTRGGVVAAARFITLEFPYIIKYFNENGRLVDNGIRKHVDGEGRYYHVGLYLHESKFDTLYRNDAGNIFKDTGPAIWGCPLYDRFISRSHANGLTCSGFVTWAMLNGGFDVGDVGAGLSSGGYSTDLWYLGTHHEITLDYMKGNTYKVGDFIARSGHAAIIIGFDETTLYVAEELPRESGTTNLDLNAYTYGRYNNTTKLPGHNKYGVVVDDNLKYVVEMSDIYPNGEGWYHDMWES